MAITFNPFTGTLDFTGTGGGGGGISGTIADTQVAFGTGVDTIGGSDNLTWDNTANKVTLTGAAGLGPDYALLLNDSSHNAAIGLFTEDAGNTSIDIASFGRSTAAQLGSDSSGLGFLVLQDRSSSPVTTALTLSPTGLLGQTNAGDTGSSIIMQAGFGGATGLNSGAFVTTFGGSLSGGGALTLNAGQAGETDQNGGDVAINGGTGNGAGSTGNITMIGGRFMLSAPGGAGLYSPTAGAADTLLFQAYDNNDNVYRTFATLTNANTPDFTITPPTGGTVNITATALSVSGFGSVVYDTATIALTVQGADIADTALTINGTGVYRVSYEILTTTADGAAGTITLNIKFTDNAAARTLSSFPSTLTSTATGYDSGVVIARVNSGSLTYGVTHTGSYGTAKYALYLTVEKLN